jgi:hypothetical protein
MKNNSRIRRAQRREGAIERAAMHVHNARETGICMINGKIVHKKDRKNG